MVLMLVLFGTVGCNEEVQAPQLEINKRSIDELVEELSRDLDFRYLITSNIKLSFEVSEADYDLSDAASTNDLVYLSKVLGFNSEADLLEFERHYLERLELVINRYGVSILTTEIIKEAASRINFNDHVFEKGQIISFSISDCNCERIRRNCLIEAAAEAVVMHAGCALLDLTVIAGAFCHAAVVTYQVAKSDNCNAAWEQCVSVCINSTVKH